MQIDFRRKVGTLILTLLFVFSATFAFGQIVTGSISGVVEDQQHAMVSGAKVTAHQDGTSYERTTTTTEAGLFTITGLPVGSYTVTIEASKFSKLKMNNVGVTVAKDSSLGVRTLTIGATETVIVEGAAPLVESTTTQIATSFESKKVADLPIGSGYDMLALFVPGIAPAGDNGFSNNNGADISSNGQRGRSNNFMIDGQSNNDNSVAGPSIFLGNQDLIGEFQIITNYSAEFGRNMGSVVNYITKGGTNSFHGTAFEYHSTNWGESLTNLEKNTFTGATAPFETSKFIDNRWGLTFGGPIIKDKAWFFFSYLGEHVRAAGSPSTSGGSLTPTPLGITQLQACYPGNNAVAALLAFGPYAITAGNPIAIGTPVTRRVSDGVANTNTLCDVQFSGISRSLTGLSNDRELTGRVDMQLSSKDRLTARYIIQDFNTVNATGRFAAGQVVDVPGRTQQIALDWNRNFTSRFVNSFRFNYSRAGFGFEGGTTACTRADVLNCFTGIGLAGANLSFGVQNNLPQGRLINNSQWQDNASWVHGRHTIKFGGEYSRQRSPNQFLPNILGTYTFSSSTARIGTALTAAAQFPGILCESASTATACRSFSRFLANQPGGTCAGAGCLSLTGGLALTNDAFGFEFKEQDFAFYGQDEWRVKDNLTLIFGVRYEFYQQAMNQLHNLTVARESDPATAFWNPALDQSLTTVHHIPNDMNNWAPNVGFAWTPKIWTGLFGENKTVIRGGFRVTYDPSYYNIFLNVRTSAPVVNAGNLGFDNMTAPRLPAVATGAGVQAAQDANIPTGAVPDPGCVGVTNPVNPGCRNQTQVTDDFRNPYSEQWNIGMQRQVTSKMAFEVRYVGNHTVGNFQTFNGNPALAGLINLGFDGTGICGPTATAFACPNFIPAGVTPCVTAGSPAVLEGAGRADCDHRNIRVRGNTAWSIYHGLQTRFDISNWHGLTANFGYTWAHTEDNVSEIFSTAAGATTVAGSQNPFDINRGERGTSGLDYRHIATLALIYELPWYKSQQGFMGHVLGGWQFNVTHRYTGGQAWTPAELSGENSACQNSFDSAFFGISTCRPFLSNPGAPIANQGICTDHTLADCGLFDFNTGLATTFADVRYILNEDEAALFFGTPYGNTPRNSERGATINNTNMGIFKTTRITERFKLRFETHIYNVLNRMYLGNPDPFFEDGSITSGSSFGNNFFNDSGGFQTNATQSGIGRRRFNFGIKLIF